MQKLPVFPPHSDRDSSGLAAFDSRTASLWSAAFVLLLAWWSGQVLAYIGRASVYAPRAPGQQEPSRDRWLLAHRFIATAKNGRDAFLLFFVAAVVMTAVGAPTSAFVIAWFYVATAVIWLLLTAAWSYRSELLEEIDLAPENARLVVPPAVNAFFSTALVALAVAMFALEIKLWD